MVMIVVIVGLVFAAFLVPMIVTQSKSTVHTDNRGQALRAAQAGTDVMLGLIRGATTDGGVTGAAGSLPCYDPLIGTLARSVPTPPATSEPPGTVAVPDYNVTLQYFTSDKLTNPMLCVTGSGTRDPVTLVAVPPSFARIVSIGTYTAGGRVSTRTLSTTYAFKTANSFSFNATNTSTTGGQIRFNPNPNPNVVVDTPQCLDAGIAPSSGTSLSVQTCKPPTTSAADAKSQLFFYNSDLSLQLALPPSAPGAPFGWCVSLSTPPNIVTLQPCASPGSAVSSQQWSLNAEAAFVVTSPGPPPVCSRLAGPSVVAAKPCLSPSLYDATASWLPTPAVGSGAAGATNSQLVNFSQFGRCAYVTDRTAPSAAPNPFMILYPCEQYVPPTPVDWYQKFAYNNASKQWVTTTGSTNFCLTRPGVVGGKVTVILCDVSDSKQKWTDYGAALANQANASQWTYDKRYTIVDSRGWCLSLSPTSGTGADWFTPINTSSQYSKLTSDTCDGSTRQKWNADPKTLSSPLQNTTGN